MTPIWKFRLLALLLVVFVGSLSISNLLAEILRPASLPLPSRTSSAPPQDVVAAADRASAIAPFRSDLKVDRAIALAARTLSSEYTGEAPGDATAQSAVKSALKMAPHDSRLWLVLALLQARSDLGDSLIAESLKMSYLTGPNRAELIPPRLDIVTLNNSLSDADLNELARSDVRAVLTQYPDLRQALIEDYGRASAVGKRFLAQSADMIDPKFAEALRRGN